MDAREELKSLRSTYEKTQEKLRDKERELAAAKNENQTLRLQVRLSALSLKQNNHKPSCIHKFQNISVSVSAAAHISEILRHAGHPAGVTSGSSNDLLQNGLMSL